MQKMEFEESTDPEKISNSLARIIFSVQTNPLLIDAVLDSLFRIVDYETLKECRCVCQKWKEISNSLFIEHSAFVLDNSTEKFLESTLESPVAVLKLFKSIKNGRVGLSEFKIRKLLLKEPIKAICLYPYKEIMTHLEITYHNNFSTYGNLNAEDLIGPNLVNLKLHAPNNSWEVSVNKLAPIQQIDLKRCFILTDLSVKIAPKVLKLDCCCFDLGQTHQILEDLSMNHFIDFRSLKTLKLVANPMCRSGIGMNISVFGLFLNLSDCVDVKSINLMAANVNLDALISPAELILEGSRCRINGEWVEREVAVVNDYLNPKAHLRKLKIIDDSQRIDFQKTITIDELEIMRLTYCLEKGVTVNTNIKILKLCLNFPEQEGFPPEIDLALLPIPRKIEDLKLTVRKNQNFCACSEPIDFPNLKYLHLGKGCVSRLVDFQDSPELKYVTLAYSNLEFGEMMEAINTDVMPRNLKGLLFKNILNSQIIGAKILHLEVLVFSFPTCELLRTAIRFFEALSNKMRIDLVVFHCHGFIGTERITNIMQFSEWQILTIMRLSLQKMAIKGKIAFGPVYWYNFDDFFHKYLDFPPFDKKSEYYLLEGQQGKGISKLEFSKLIPFDIVL